MAELYKHRKTSIKPIESKYKNVEVLSEKCAVSPRKNDNALHTYVSDLNKDGGLDYIVRKLKTVSIGGLEMSSRMKVFDSKVIKSFIDDIVGGGCEMLNVKIKRS